MITSENGRVVVIGHFDEAKIKDCLASADISLGLPFDKHIDVEMIWVHPTLDGNGRIGFRGSKCLSKLWAIETAFLKTGKTGNRSIKDHISLIPNNRDLQVLSCLGGLIIEGKSTTALVGDNNEIVFRLIEADIECSFGLFVAFEGYLSREYRNDHADRYANPTADGIHSLSVVGRCDFVQHSSTCTPDHTVGGE